MPDYGRRSPARLLAPLALLAFVGALALILLNSSVVDGDNGQNTDTASQRTTTAKSTETTPRRRPRRRFYTVKLNDTFEAIAEKTGVSVARLQALNPEADPQALVAGQRLKLRE